MRTTTLPHCHHVIIASLSAILACASVVAAQATEDLYLIDANLVDPTARQVHRGNLLIRDGIIVATPQRPPADFAGRTLDLDGKWVIPGLGDLHTHTFGNADPAGRPIDRPEPAGVAQRMLYAGVTAFLDLFGDQDLLFETREQQRAGETGGADMFASLSCITAPGGHGTEYGVEAHTVSSPEEARRAVEDLKRRHADVIKIIYGLGAGRPSIDRATLFATIAAARANGLKTVVHVEGWQLVRDAVEAGATAVTHVPGGAIPEDLPRLMVARNVASIPTLTVHTDFPDFVNEAAVLDNPMARALTTPAVIAAYRSADVSALVAKRQPEFEANTAGILRSVKAMADAGVTILAGTDSGSPGTLQGYSVHRELIKLVEAGLSSWQALAAATTEAGAFLGRAYGVTPGSEANLVVLDASPIDDIRNTQRIAYVIHHGAIVDREAVLESELAGLRR
jgi:imidazolonepropionase-like amidohydrolase